MSNFVEQIILSNGLAGGTYVEAYAGGAGIAWQLLFDNFVSNVCINDINRSVYSLWYSVLNHTEELCRLIKDTPVTMDEWHRQKNKQTVADVTVLELGFSTFFLNRTNRSGIILAGVIGGKKQDGAYKLDARYNKESLIARIKKIALYKEKISLYRQDALVFINSIVPNLPQQSLIYLDPPYYQKGSVLYEHHYSHQDHVAVASALQKLKHKWIVSYDNAPEIFNIYSGYRNIVYDLAYSASGRYSGHEVMFFSSDLIIPDGDPLSAKHPKTIEAHLPKQFVFQSGCIS